MTLRPSFASIAAATITATLATLVASAHSASDAYLTLIAQPRAAAAGTVKTVVRAQWDVALRDLDFVLKLDDNGDGHIKWGELRKHQQAIAQYVYARIRLTADGKACDIVPIQQMVDYHADGAYAALIFDIVCLGAPKKLTVAYQLFFSVDPSHRAILIFHDRDNIATSVFSPNNAKIDLVL